MEEIWKDIKGYENKYQVSNLGRVKSIMFVNRVANYKREKYLKFSKDRDGYENLSLCNKNQKKTYKIHKLVANAFIPNKQNKLCVNHINGIKTDNRAENLEWCTYRENIQHSYKLGLQKPKYKKTLQYDLKNNFIKEWKSVKQASEILKINRGNICTCCLGKRNKAGGYIWRYADEKRT